MESRSNVVLQRDDMSGLRLDLCVPLPHRPAHGEPKGIWSGTRTGSISEGRGLLRK